MRTGNLLLAEEFYNDEESVECPLPSKDISTAKERMKNGRAARIHCLHP